MIFSVLGSGTTVPDPERGPAGFLVQVKGRAWLVDGGTGTLQRCAKAGVDPRKLDGGFYSHRHPDHCADLVALLFAMRVGPPPRKRDYPVYAGRGFRTFFEGLKKTWGHWITPGSGKVVVHELSIDDEDQVDLGDLTVRTAPAAHSGGALHLRFESEEGTVVFSGDTGPSEALVALSREADLLVCACAGSDASPIRGHMTPSDIADLAQRAAPSQIWLTHLYPHVDPALAVSTVAASGVPTRRAADGDRWAPHHSHSMVAGGLDDTS